MSRNLLQTHCDQCPSPLVILEEEPRPIEFSDAGIYFEEYQFMKVARAHCPLCLAEYLAWVSHCPYWDTPSDPNAILDYRDLSYRSTFDDEPGESDKAKRHVGVRLTL